MGRHTGWFVCGCGLLLCAAGLVGSPSQGQEAKPQNCQVGLVDLKQVFDKLPTFKEQLETLKREVEGREKEFKQRMTEFSQKVAEHKKLSPAEQQAAREPLEQEQKELKTWMDEQKRHFLQKEATIYESHYRMISDEIARQAQKRGIALVLRTNESAVDQEGEQPQRAPDQVMRLLNKPVLYQREELDLTNAVIAGLNP